MVVRITRDEGQKEKFIEAARRAGTDESPDSLDKIMGKLDLTKKPETTLAATKQKSSDRQR